MTLKLNKINNQIYIVDVEGEIQIGDLFYLEDAEIVIKYIDSNPAKEAIKVIATPEQIDIDNLFEKWVEALAEKAEQTLPEKVLPLYRAGIMDGYIQAKKETCWSDADIKLAHLWGLAGGMENYLQKLKLSKIPECEVELEMEQSNNKPGTHYAVETKYKPKLTNNKVTVTKLTL